MTGRVLPLSVPESSLRGWNACTTTARKSHIQNTSLCGCWVDLGNRWTYAGLDAKTTAHIGLIIECEGEEKMPFSSNIQQTNHLDADPVTFREWEGCCAGRVTVGTQRIEVPDRRDSNMGSRYPSSGVGYPVLVRIYYAQIGLRGFSARYLEGRSGLNNGSR
ncbi:hypothetical protein SISNIDRAFT_351893 [Sistotremastrum niveocremeum HHB9708]|uniref:Uncharacterized protein n=1 Tax=Sistotremastrum niveocremeum HHB9708 TaxID=1314777 RepID=A0A164X2A5_9AGAM|nr:hypothetical protein SISNIDRAFT_351893 [Sistotremastrum niveocremeum HHB9708]